ncbi:hypothetical protein TON_0735 [Thermococcus onnurineus NA1]|uniref:Uncharacterized protein n=1 Tax=Thermococcus onnurineus (strain NA1) TaxID=523850 RepID=B6YVE5_THEON|nr:hypothetical protein [Thermococcus onnurineus]ACJ16223.1 hypothetical protein TON_0735 [Thermococcus onnurineus NA1]
MPYNSAPSGWISIILGLILIAIMVFAFYQMNKTLGELKLELSNLRNTLEETKRHTEDVKKKLEEV